MKTLTIFYNSYPFYRAAHSIDVFHINILIRQSWFSSPYEITP